MLDEKLIALITEEVVRQLTASGRVILPDSLSAEPAEGKDPVSTDRLLVFAKHEEIKEGDK